MAVRGPSGHDTSGEMAFQRRAPCKRLGVAATMRQRALERGRHSSIITPVRPRKQDFFAVRESDKSMVAQQLDEQIAQHAQICTNLQDEVARVLVGQQHMLSRLLIGLLTGGHILLEGLPGLAKTLTIRSLATAIDTGFSRIQFTPDMLPADVIGTEIFNPRESTYVVRKGPIFSNLILADEINRAPAKVQAALLEAMQERQGTIGLESFPLEEPFPGAGDPKPD